MKLYYCSTNSVYVYTGNKYGLWGYAFINRTLVLAKNDWSVCVICKSMESLFNMGNLIHNII